MELSYQDLGEGQPLIIIHGLFGAAKNWNAIAKQLSRRYRVLTLDLRNHGDSPWTDTMSYPEMAQDILDFMDQRGLQTAPIVGHSMGGKVAMTAALLAPERVEKLIIADIAPVVYPRGTFKSFVAAMKALPLESVSRRSQLDGFLAETIDSPAIRAFLLGNIANGNDGLRWQLNLDTLGREMGTIGGVPTIDPAACYEGPTLFINGGKSDYVQPSHHQLIKKLFPAVTFQTLEGAGHWLHAEKPHEFMQAVDDFVS